MGTPNPKGAEVVRPQAPQCRATSRTSGQQCKRRAIPGGTVCRYHGGAAPQVQRAAKLRLLELVDPAIAVLAREMTNQQATPGERLRAVENVLDRSGYPRKATVDSSTARDILLERLERARAEQLTDPDNQG